MTRGIALLALSLTALSVAPGARAAAGPNADDYRGGWETYGAGVGPHIYEFSIRGQRVRGMVCGRCDNPYTMAALDDFQIQGDTLRFDILHEDWGPGRLPSHNQVTAHIADNEMRISTELNNTRTHGVAGFEVHASLYGPVAAAATAGN